MFAAISDIIVAPVPSSLSIPRYVRGDYNRRSFESIIGEFPVSGGMKRWRLGRIPKCVRNAFVKALGVE